MAHRGTQEDLYDQKLAWRCPAALVNGAFTEGVKSSRTIIKPFVLILLWNIDGIIDVWWLTTLKAASRDAEEMSLSYHLFHRILQISIYALQNAFRLKPVKMSFVTTFKKLSRYETWRIRSFSKSCFCQSRQLYACQMVGLSGLTRQLKQGSKILIVAAGERSRFASRCNLW